MLAPTEPNLFVDNQKKTLQPKPPLHSHQKSLFKQCDVEIANLARSLSWGMNKKDEGKPSEGQRKKK